MSVKGLRTGIRKTVAVQECMVLKTPSAFERFPTVIAELGLSVYLVRMHWLFTLNDMYVSIPPPNPPTQPNPLSVFYASNGGWDCVCVSVRISVYLFGSERMCDSYSQCVKNI